MGKKITRALKGAPAQSSVSSNHPSPAPIFLGQVPLDLGQDYMQTPPTDKTSHTVAKAAGTTGC